MKLHPDKFYCLLSYKGCKFTGSVVKQERTYLGNLTIGNFTDKLRYIDTNDVEGAIHSINSYLGFLKHHRTYNVKKQLLLLISLIFGDTIEVHENKISKSL